jgi:hypothetical protein
VFRDSLVGNIEQLVDMLPGLNVLNDPDLDAIGKEVKARLLGYDLKDLRKKPAVRSAAAREAQEIMDKMAGFMTCFQQAAE